MDNNLPWEDNAAALAVLLQLLDRVLPWQPPPLPPLERLEGEACVPEPPQE